MAIVKTRKSAIILARVSTAGQAEDELPIDSQLDACRSRAEQKEADVVKVFIEDGVSGRKMKRDTFDEAVEYCTLFDIDYFILWDTARFARNKALASWTKFNLRKNGTEMIYVSQNIDTSTDEGWLLEGIYEIFDEQKSRTVSKDTIRSLMKNARDGNYNGGAVPFGYRVVAHGKRKRLAIVEEEAEIIRQVFIECRAGSGAKSLVLWLNGSGRLRRGVPWTKNTMMNTLQNYVYAGYTTFNRVHHATRTVRPADEWVRVRSHDPIVPEEEFMATLKVIQSRAPASGNGSPLSRHLFTGLVRCGCCDMGLKITSGRGRGKKTYSYYDCGGAVQGKGCKSRPIPAHKLDAWLMETLRERILSRDRMMEFARQVHDMSGSWVRDRAAQRQALVTRLRDCERRRGNLFSLLEEHGKDAPNLGDLTVRLRELSAEIKATEAELDQLERMPPPAVSISPESIDELTQFVHDTLEYASEKKVRQFLGTFVERIVLQDRSAVIHYHPGRLVNAHQGEVVHSTGNWLPELVRLRTAAFDLPERYWRRAA